MAAAYGELRKLLPAAEARSLRDLQRLWIKSRDDICAWRAEAERADCIVDATQKRWRMLAGQPEAGPGTGAARLIPYAVARQGDSRSYTLDIATVMFAAPATPGERAFNDAVKALYADAPRDETIDFESPGELSYNLALEITYASPDFISALASGWRYDGGAHGNSWTRAVNVDLKNGRLMTFAALFPASARAVFAKLCRDQLVGQKRDKMVASEQEARRELESYESTIDEHIADLSTWAFHTGRAEVTFDPYALGSYVEGEYSCRFDGGVIRLYANPGISLPQ